MKTTLLLVLIVCLFCSSFYAQQTNDSYIHNKKQKHNLRMEPRQHQRSEDDKSYKLRYGDREIPITTYNGQNPNERQLEIVKKTLTEDFLVNDDTIGGAMDQRIPSISMDGSGNFVIAWEDERNGNWDIYYQRYNSSGVKQGINSKANDDAGTAWQYNSTIAMDGSGNFVIAWRDARNGNWDIYYQHYNSSGVNQGVNQKANDDAGTADQGSPSISMDGLGNFVMVWEDRRNGNSDIYYQRYDSSGVNQGVNQKANDDVGTVGQFYPSVSIDETGNFMIVWHDYRNGNFDIYYQRYNSSGVSQGVNQKANDDFGTAVQWYPLISMDGSGNFVIAWQDNRNGNYNSDIYFQRYNSSGVNQGVNQKANDDAGTAEQLYPSISMDGGGNFILVWEDYRYGMDNPDVIGQRFYANGSQNGSNYRIVADGPNYREKWPVVTANNTKIVFSWMDNRRSESWDIYAKIVGWDWNGVTSVTQENNLPEEFSLTQNYPNPFNPVTKIRYTIPSAISPLLGGVRGGFVTLKVYDVLGNEVVTLVDEYKPAGSYEVEFSARGGQESGIGNLASGIGYASGVYFYQLKAGELIETKKMMLLR